MHLMTIALLFWTRSNRVFNSTQHRFSFKILQTVPAYEIDFFNEYYKFLPATTILHMEFKNITIKDHM